MNVIKRRTMNKYRAFTLLETLIALSILLVLLPLVSSIFYGSVKRYLKYAEENKEIAQIEFSEMYLNKISKVSDSMNVVGEVLRINSGVSIHDVGVKNNKLYTMQTATRYLTVEPMLITNHKFMKINDNYYQIELQTQTNRKYLIKIIRY
ncbi:MAG: prepilin-type N-terminal cleavage/methylation domain-containing protein [Candidatus Riflemargulisbacteria bacterium]